MFCDVLCLERILISFCRSAPLEFDYLKSSHEKLSPSLTLQLEAPVPPQVAGHKVALAVVAAVQAVQNQK